MPRHYCKKKGHLAKVCRSKAKAAKAKPRQGTSSRAKRTHKTHVLTEEHVDEAPVYSLFKLTNPHLKPLLVTLQVNGADLEMEVDTGTAVSVVSAESYCTLWLKELAPALHPANVKLRTYTREPTPEKNFQCRVPPWSQWGTKTKKSSSPC